MAEFEVKVTKTVTYTGVLHVSADDEDEAEDTVRDLLKHQSEVDAVDWDLDDENIEVDEVIEQ